MTGIELKESIEELEFVKDRFYEFPEETGISKNITDIENAIKAIRELEEYYAIGTIEEYQQARDRQKAKKIITVKARNEKKNVSVGDFVHYKCPNCGKIIGSAFHYPPNEYMMEHKFCDGCSQKFDWYETKCNDNQKI